MKETIHIRSHNVEMLNNVTLLSDSEMSNLVETAIREQTPLSDKGIAELQQLAEVYHEWGAIRFHLVNGPDDLCKKCDGFNSDSNQCGHQYSFDKPNLTPEQNRIDADRNVLERHPRIKTARTLKEAHEFSVGS